VQSRLVLEVDRVLHFRLRAHSATLARQINPQASFMKILFRQKLFLALFSILSLTLLLSPAQAATKAKSKAAQKERLVLLPMDISAESRSMYGQQESAVVEGLAQKYEVFSGERVMQELRKAASKESSRAKGNCDETRCLEDVAIALQTENVAMVHVTKTEGGYLLSISIKNVMTNQAVFDKSLPCEGCSVFKVIEKLKELGGALAPAAEAPQPKVNQNDPDAVLWAEAQKGNSADDYQVYIDTYPKGKYLPFAKARIKKLKDEAQAAAEQQEQSAWDTAQQSSSEDSYAQYLKGYPTGRFAGLAKVRLDKLKNDVAARAEAELWKTAQASEDSKVVQSFLNQYPRSAHLAAAQERLASLKKAEAELKPGKVIKDCAECPEMVVVPAGSFTMGSNKGGDESPAHSVTIAKAFALGKTEITRGQFAAFVNATNYDAGNECYVLADNKWEKRTGNNWRNPGFQQDDSHPVACINWNDAKAYVEWLSRKTGKPYRLPTESQWEYACRAGGQNEYCGSDDVDSIAWYGRKNGDTTHPSAQKQSNLFGLYDMSGNVWEWTADSYHDTYNGAPGDGSEWQGDGARRVLRGGSWGNDPRGSRAAYRGNGTPANRFTIYGFRVSRTLP